MATLITARPRRVRDQQPQNQTAIECAEPNGNHRQRATGLLADEVQVVRYHLQQHASQAKQQALRTLERAHTACARPCKRMIQYTPKEIPICCCGGGKPSLVEHALDWTWLPSNKIDNWRRATTPHPERQWTT